MAKLPLLEHCHFLCPSCRWARALSYVCRFQRWDDDGSNNVSWLFTWPAKVSIIHSKISWMSLFPVSSSIALVSNVKGTFTADNTSGLSRIGSTSWNCIDIFLWVCLSKFGIISVLITIDKLSGYILASMSVNGYIQFELNSAFSICTMLHYFSFSFATDL